VAGLAFLEHGTGKLIGFPHGLPFIDQMPAGLLYFTGTMEFVGGALIVLGLFTRPVAFILSGFMAAAYFMAHFPVSFFPAINMGEAAVLYCFISSISRRRALALGCDPAWKSGSDSILMKSRCPLVLVSQRNQCHAICSRLDVDPARLCCE
jgi:hypothetical protein